MLRRTKNAGKLQSLAKGTTGSNRDAFLAGANPNINPVAAAQLKAKTAGKVVNFIDIPSMDIR
tara:strand:- start:8 stop:196 length:189 start_codon:yes stop_codon:yes gene_type:complete